jgi:hypothetical protein
MTPVAAGFLSGIFLVAGVAKLHARNAFSVYLSSLGLPTWVAVPVISAEIAVGGAIASGLALRVTSAVAVFLSMVFVGVQIYDGRRGLRCACFGVVDHLLAREIGYARASLVAAASIACAVGAWSARSPWSVAAVGSGVLIALTVVLVIALGGELVVAWRGMSEIRRKATETAAARA